MITSPDILRIARSAWGTASALRSRRSRNLRFTFGDQWDEPALDDAGRPSTDRRVALEAGVHPVTNNMIRPMVRTIVGRFRQDSIGYYKKCPVPSSAIPAELDARALEEFLISGCVVQRVVPVPDSVDVSNINPAMFFTNPYSDPRGTDVDVVGCLHDMSLAEILCRFGRGNAKRTRKIQELYAALSRSAAPDDPQAAADVTFLRPAQGRCRVIEVWTRRLSPMISIADRPATPRSTWICRWLAPDATELASYTSPLPGGVHPFVFRHYPLTDGTVRPLVEDVIDQQRAVNRMVTLIDRLVTTSAKGVLLFPVRQLTPGNSLEQVSKVWSSSSGVIPLSGNCSEMPQQVVTKDVTSGVTEVLDTQMQLFRDISGVSSALLGTDVPAATGSGLYNAQTQNSLTAIADILHSFSCFLDARDRLVTSIKK